MNIANHKSKTAPRNFLDICETPAVELRKIMNLAHSIKKMGRKQLPDHLSLSGDLTVLAMIFEKPSTRTRLSFDMAMRQLGGETTILNANDMQLGRGESIADTAKILSRFVDIVMIRSNSHERSGRTGTSRDHSRHQRADRFFPSLPDYG